MDPRHRLVTTKYNPARTWTPENAVGIGGAYMCVYGMEGPGGYQFVGRTVQMWNRHHQTADFRDGKPWLLRFFDQIRFHPVSAEELERLRAGFPFGLHPLRIEPSTLRLADYREFLAANEAGIADFKRRQQAAFEAERERWRIAGHNETAVAEPAAPQAESVLPAGCEALSAPVSGSVWQIKVKPGQRIAAGDELVVLEAMKMEISIRADSGGTVEALYCAPGAAVAAGSTLLALRPEEVTA